MEATHHYRRMSKLCVPIDSYLSALERVEGRILAAAIAWMTAALSIVNLLS